VKFGKRREEKEIRKREGRGAMGREITIGHPQRLANFRQLCTVRRQCYSGGGGGEERRGKEVVGKGKSDYSNASSSILLTFPSTAQYRASASSVLLLNAAM
jgi:hypothetical protein